MTENHPITPPRKLVQQWHADWYQLNGKYIGINEYLATQAARWGADQELEACCKVLEEDLCCFVADDLRAARRAARRPKPPSLAEQALAVVENSAICDHIRPEHETTLRRALERLKELEQSND